VTRIFIPIVWALAICAPSARADVVDAAAGGFTVRTTVDVSAASIVVYRALMDVARWWAPDHTFSGSAANLSIDARPGGCFCERLPGGGGVHHLTVVYADPGKMLRLNGGLGPLQDMAVAGSLTFKLTESSGKTTIETTYKVGGYAPGGLEALAKIVDGVLAAQVQRLKKLIETGRPD